MPGPADVGFEPSRARIGAAARSFPMFLLNANVISGWPGLGDGRANARVASRVSGHDAAGLSTSAPRSWNRRSTSCALSAPASAVAAPPRPAVTVASDGDVTQDSPAVFTLTRTGDPVEELDMACEVTATGDFGAATGARRRTTRRSQPCWPRARSSADAAASCRRARSRRTDVK